MPTVAPRKKKSTTTTPAAPPAEPTRVTQDRLWLVAHLEMLLHKVCLSHRDAGHGDQCPCGVCRPGVDLTPQVVEHKGFLIGMRLPVAHTPADPELLTAMQVLAEHAAPLGG